MRGIALLRLVIGACAVLQAGCAHHRATTCAKPAKVVGTNARDSQGGWVLVSADQSPADVAERIAAKYHVRTQALTYLHGFSTFPVPDDPKFFCDKSVVEVHYAPQQSLAGR